MFKGHGRSVFSGVAIGPVYAFERVSAPARHVPVLDEATELSRFHTAKETAAEQLRALYEKTRREIGEDEAMIIDVQMMMLDDGDYNDAIEESIRGGKGADAAVAAAGRQFSEFFASLDDPYMKARAADVRDVSQRLSDILCGREGVPALTEPMVLVADDLTPSETVALDKNNILAFVTRQGSANSHTAILARIMNIPSLVQADVPDGEKLHGRMIAVDGFTGEYFLDPDEATVARLREKRRADTEQRRALDAVRGLPSVTKSGRQVRLYANIGGPEDVPAVLFNDAEGVGLFRSEFLYLGRDDYPSEDEQFEAYRKVAEQMGGKPVIIRTLDIGADKKADYFGLAREENPALGFRAIRICLERPELFKTQLRAIYRASAYGKVAVMFPMIISADETKRALALAAEARAELAARGIVVDEIERGVMIETPAAVMVSAELAKLVDFFSVGTNDLTQYTLAIDRQNEQLDKFYDPHHPAVLEMLRVIAQNAHAAGIWAGICGELAADAELTDTFLKMGYDELSVSPPFILELRKRIRDSAV